MTTTSVSKLPKPPGNGNLSRHIRESHHIVRERGFDNSEPIESVLQTLKSDRSTGQLVIDLSQGGVNNIRFQEKKKVDFEE